MITIIITVALVITQVTVCWALPKGRWLAKGRKSDFRAAGFSITAEVGNQDLSGGAQAATDLILYSINIADLMLFQGICSLIQQAACH